MSNSRICFCSLPCGTSACQIPAPRSRKAPLSYIQRRILEKIYPKSEFHAPESVMTTNTNSLRKDGRGGTVGNLSEILGLLSVALNPSAVQQAEGTAAWQSWKSRKSGNSIPHLTSFISAPQHAHLGASLFLLQPKPSQKYSKHTRISPGPLSGSLAA